MTLLSLQPRLYQDEPPDIQDRHDNNPTLLVTWWCTCVALVIILVRLGGRYRRVEKWFREDKVMALSMLPLLIRMGLVHVVLIWGTNNTKTDGLTRLEIYHRSIGSRLVLAARIFYTAFIWIAKWSVSEFLKRLIGQSWRRSYELILRSIRYFLIVTFIAVVVATLSECQPFDHYWQVVPDPGPKCRLGYGQLITMGVCDIITDILLVIFPIPIVIVGNMGRKRKVSLTFLFSLSLILVAITSYRVPSVIARRGSQQYRSLFASLEIIAEASVANAVVIGSFIRDRGMKKAKFKYSSVSSQKSSVVPEAMMTTNNTTMSSARNRHRDTLTHHQWGSDADLVGDLGMRLGPEFEDDLVAQRRQESRSGSRSGSGSGSGSGISPSSSPGNRQSLSLPQKPENSSIETTRGSKDASTTLDIDLVLEREHEHEREHEYQNRNQDRLIPLSMPMQSTTQEPSPSPLRTKTPPIASTPTGTQTTDLEAGRPFESRRSPMSTYILWRWRRRSDSVSTTIPLARFRSGRFGIPFFPAVRAEAHGQGIGNDNGKRTGEQNTDAN